MRFELTAEGRLRGAKFIYVAEQARNPRAVRGKTLRVPRRYATRSQPILRQNLRSWMMASRPPCRISMQVDRPLWLGWKRALAVPRGSWLSVQHSFPTKDAVTTPLPQCAAAAEADQTAWLTGPSRLVA